jgi:hypothetical protein
LDTKLKKLKKTYLEKTDIIMIILKIKFLQRLEWLIQIILRMSLKKLRLNTKKTKKIEKTGKT